jgi:8-oxo-dGTP pyrophosphatase MutT (NUDIX family)
MLHTLQHLRDRASLPPVRPRDALFLEGISGAVGSIEALLAARMVRSGLPMCAGERGWKVRGAPTSALAELAAWLHEQGLAGRWRDEALDVTDDAGLVRAVIERAAVRPLGITTFATHLVGVTPRGQVWVQQRALDKATDPGLWDTLMGGLRSAGETARHTLERETWEEAGLQLDALRKLEPLGRLTVSRPVDAGYMVEHIDLFEAEVPDGLEPVNQDGEVARFESVAPAQLLQRVRNGAFTLEAALILMHWLQRRDLLPRPAGA